MSNQESARKLAEIQQVASEFNQQLVEDDKIDEGVRKQIEDRGGCLFLGKHYAYSPRIIMTINPGHYEGNEDGATVSSDGFFVERQEENPWAHPKHLFWKNFKEKFVADSRPLQDWVDLATVTYCFPWRTDNAEDVRRLERLTRSGIQRFSGEIFRKMLEHHRGIGGFGTTVTVIACGKKSLDWLKSKWFMDFELGECAKGPVHGKDKYQWREVLCDNVPVYQVPHFSRANSIKLLRPCAEWLVSNLGIGSSSAGFPQRL